MAEGIGERRIEAEILLRIAHRWTGPTLSPSEVARARAGGRLAARGRIDVTTPDRPVPGNRTRGPIRLGLPE